MASQRKPLITAAPLIPRHATLTELKDVARTCQACPLWKLGTQTVFGDGPPDADVMMVGEQPGHEEDLQGKPFVGPAGRILRRALLDAGISPERIYLANVVKHFNWELRGKRRIHKKPHEREIAACLPWLQAEIATLKPRALVLLGATAAQALLGKTFRVTRERGVPLTSPLAPLVLATVHPSAILRAPDNDAQHLELQRLTDDFRALAAASENRS